MRRSIKYILYIVPTLILVGIVIGTFLYFKPHKNIATANADFSIGAQALYRDFNTNEIAANTKYLNKIIEVDGIVDNASLNDHGDLTIMLKVPEVASGNILCTIPSTNLKQGKNPDKGQKVKIKGTCSGLSIDDVVLDRCVLVE
jgi:hypothetical protein